MKHPRRSLAALGCLLLLAACAASETVSNTGYVGTWGRGGEVRSVLAIVRDGEGYRVRWSLTSDSGAREVRCDWEGKCKETTDGELSAEFELRPSVAADTGNLWIECDGKVYKPVEGDFHFRDELVVRPRGKKLVAHTIEELGKEWKRGEGQPRRIFEKVSDHVDDPPTSGG